MPENRPEQMAQFFDARADTYDDHMSASVPGFDQFYAHVASGIDRTETVTTILDLGCGTGLELEHIFRRAPQAVITCVDLSEKMLALLSEKYSAYLRQLKLVRGSYLDLDFGDRLYDYVVSVMTVHHLVPDAKLSLYRKLRRALNQGGRYIEGDYVISPEREREYLAAYYEEVGRLGIEGAGTYHIDIPFSLQTQRGLLLRAGFSSIEVCWQRGEATVMVADG